MKAIQTKYHGPTNTRGARISASDLDGNRCTINYPHEFSGERVYWEAAHALCLKMGWIGILHGGALGCGAYVFVFEGERYTVWPDGSASVESAPFVAQAVSK